RRVLDQGPEEARHPRLLGRVEAVGEGQSVPGAGQVVRRPRSGRREGRRLPEEGDRVDAAALPARRQGRHGQDRDLSVRLALALALISCGRDHRAPTSPGADCALVAETLTSFQLGNYAELEQRRPKVAAWRAKCEVEELTK